MTTKLTIIILGLVLAAFVVASCGEQAHLISSPKGPQGKAGAQGSQGQAGLAGEAGLPGEDGLDGENCEISCKDKHHAVISCPSSSVEFKISHCKDL